MDISRRGFIKLTGAGAACLGLSELGLDLAPVRAVAADLKIEGAKEVVSICHFCSCGCNMIMSVKDGRMVAAGGDPDFPVSEGALCAKGAAFQSMHYSPRRLQKPLYRAPGSDRWEEKEWDFVLDRIARKIKDTRDRDFIVKNGKGQQVNRVESIFELGASQLDNEECALTRQMLAGLGVIHMDHQARI